MRRVSVAAVAVSSVALLVGVVATPAAAAAPNATCTGALPPGTYQNVTVPTGASCVINGSDVILGNVTVGSGALFDDFAASIGGNLQADHAAAIDVADGSVGGNVSATATSDDFSLCGSTVGNDVVVQSGGFSVIGRGVCAGFTEPGNIIGGNLTVQNNAGSVSAELNQVLGNISVHNNVGGGRLTGNSADGNCQLFNNNPPIAGASNTVPPGHTNTCNGFA